MRLAAPLPLYTRHLLRNGRCDHTQIGNAALLGCLLSHMQAWRLVRPGERVAILEEVATAFSKATQTPSDAPPKPPLGPPFGPSDAPPQQDAQIDALSVARLRLLAQDIAPHPWDIVLLDSVLFGFSLAPLWPLFSSLS